MTSTNSILLKLAPFCSQACIIQRRSRQEGPDYPRFFVAFVAMLTKL